MCAKWKDTHFDVGAVLERINNLHALAEDASMKRGRSGYDIEIASDDGQHAIEEYESLLLSAITFGKLENDSLKEGLLGEAIFSVLSDRPLNPDHLIDEVTRLEGEYLSRDPVKHELRGVLSVQYEDCMTHREADGVRVTFSNKGLIEFKQSDAWSYGLGKMEENLVPQKMNRTYTNFRAHVEARSEAEAVERGLGALDLIREIWNLRFTSSFRRSLTSGGEYKPVNQIIYGPRFVLSDSSRVWGEAQALLSCPRFLYQGEC